jgi:hypothetical protein
MNYDISHVSYNNQQTSATSVSYIISHSLTRSRDAWSTKMLRSHAKGMPIRRIMLFAAGRAKVLQQRAKCV